MLTIKGRFENGAVQLSEQVEGLEGQEVIVAFLNGEDTEAHAFDMTRTASLSTLLEYWDNEEDAVYDNL